MTDEIVLPEDFTAIEEQTALDKDRASQRDTNQRKVQALEQAGINVAPLLLGMRLEAVVERLLPEGTPERAAFDAEFEAELGPKLDEVASQVRAAMLQRDAQMGQDLLNKPGPKLVR